MTQVFIKFKPDAFWISKNSSFSSIIDRVKYFYIRTLNRFQNHSLYFKYQNYGFCLIFMDEKAADGKECFQNILLLKEKDELQNPDFKLGRFGLRSNSRFDQHGLCSGL